MRLTAFLLFSFVSTLAMPAEAASRKAKNVIVFLADAGGVATVNAASIHGYGEAQKLFVQSWPQVGLSDTSTATQWVSDSAAGMTAIVTGVKTQNGVLSMGPDAVRGKKDGAVLKTLLEYAEERGLSTGVITNVNIADATPAACYAHSNDRRKFAEIFQQAFNPRYGDGVDVLIGGGRKPVEAALSAANLTMEGLASAKGRAVRTSVAEVKGSDSRPVVVSASEPDVPAAVDLALERLSKNKKGYFLMVEWDAHTDDPRKGLDNLVGLDKLIREVAGKVNMKETLLIFTADHSFDLHVRGGKKGEPLLQGLEAWKEKNAAQKQPYMELPNVRVHGSHTGEEVMVAAQGPGAEQVRGFMPNTRVFEIMLAAYGWQAGKK